VIIILANNCILEYNSGHFRCLDTDCLYGAIFGPYLQDINCIRLAVYYAEPKSTQTKLLMNVPDLHHYLLDNKYNEWIFVVTIIAFSLYSIVSGKFIKGAQDIWLTVIYKGIYAFTIKI